MASVFKRGGKDNRGGYWYIQWFDHNGKRRTKCSKTTDKAAAERIAAKHEADAALRRDGVIDPTLDAISAQAKRSIEDHLKDYEAKLRTAGRNPQYVANTLTMIRAIVRDNDWTIASDIHADGVNRYAGKLKDKKKSARTQQYHLTAIKGFTRWLASQHKLPRDPLMSVRKPNPETDRRHERRMLLPEEWRWLRAATLAGSEREGMTPTERVLLYAMAIQTGLRAGELRSLTRGQLFLTQDPPFIVCKAGSTKNGKDARQYVQADLADELRKHAARKAPQAPVFNLPNKYVMAEMLRADLADARREWIKAAKHDPDEAEKRRQSDFLADENHEGERLDFHSLRHTCGAWLAMSRAHPSAVKAVMRHSSITLTMDTYGHLFPGQEAQTIAGMPALLSAEPKVLKATGTMGSAPLASVENEGGAQRLAQHSARVAERADAAVCVSVEVEGEENARHNVLPLDGLCDEDRDVATKSESRAAGTRTRNQQIMSLLL